MKKFLLCCLVVVVLISGCSKKTEKASVDSVEIESVPVTPIEIPVTVTETPVEPDDVEDIKAAQDNVVCMYSLAAILSDDKLTEIEELIPESRVERELREMYKFHEILCLESAEYSENDGEGSAKLTLKIQNSTAGFRYEKVNGIWYDTGYVLNLENGSCPPIIFDNALPSNIDTILSTVADNVPAFSGTFLRTNYEEGNTSITVRDQEGLEFTIELE